MARAWLAAVGVMVLMTASCGGSTEERAAPTTTDVASSTTTASTAPPMTASTSPTTTNDAEADVRQFQPGDEFTFDASALELDVATPLLIIQTGAELPVWTVVGSVGDDVLTLPAIDGAWRLTGLEFGEAVPTHLIAGEYELQTFRGPLLETIVITRDGESVGHEAERASVDSDLAILREDGLADIDFGTPTEQAVRHLVERFGEPVEDVLVAECLTQRILRFENGMHARFDETFAEYAFYAWDEPVRWTETTDIPWPPEIAERQPFTTEKGIGLGDMARGFWPWVRLSGDYQGNVFAEIWFESERLGGRLASDVSVDPRIISIEAGRDGNPARTIC